MNWSWIVGPLVGAVIGYCTNYIAVKMLFRPKNEIRLLGHRLPLTPGAIPKGKPRLARAVGEVVSGTLVTGEDIEKQLLNDEVENLVAGKVMSYLALDLPNAVGNVTGEPETLSRLEEQAAGMISIAILQAAAEVNMGELFAVMGPQIMGEKLQGSIISMFVSEQQLSSIARGAGEQAQLYIADNGRDLLEPKILEQIRAMEDKSVLDALETIGVDRCSVRQSIIALYEDAVHEGIMKAMAQLNLSGMIEDKINAMSVDELERLVFAVMKNELNAIVNLGALIGFVLGLVMLFV